MLVLSRKVNETIIIGDDIKITLLDCNSDKASLGFEAPKSVKIIRGELLVDTIKANIDAVACNFDDLK